MNNDDPITQAPMGKDDAALVGAAQGGDRKAFVDIVARYQGMVTGVTLAVLGDFGAGEDAAQEAFVSAWQKIGTLRDPAKLRSWLTQIARNTAISHRRRQRPGEPLHDSLEDGAPGPDELVASDDERATVLAALEALPEKLRLPMVLFYREGESVRSVAQSLDLSEDVVKKRLAKGRQLLRDRVVRLIDSVVGGAMPGAMFTAAVASLIGALVKPSAVAANAFAAGQAAKPIAATATAMTASKLTLTTAALVAAACIPVGYTTHMALASNDRQPAASSLAGDALQSRAIELSESEIVAEWRRLREHYGESEGALAGLHGAIEALPSELRRRAFHLLLATEWVRVDPHAALAFYRAEERPEWQRMRFLEEWVRVDGDAAVDGLIGSGAGWEDLAYPLLDEIAASAPHRVREVVAALPLQSDFRVGVAFKVLAAHDPAGACLMAEGLSDHARSGAVAGTAGGWAEIDPRSAFAWSQSLADREERRSAVKAVLETWAKREPFAVLEHIGLSAPNDRMSGEVLGRAAAEDFGAALAWVRDHPGAVSTSGMAEAVGERLSEDSIGLLEQFESEGVLLTMLDALREQPLLTRDSEGGRAAWDWLLDPARSGDVIVVRQQLIHSSPPRYAMQLVDGIPNERERFQLMGEVAKMAVSNGDDPFADLPLVNPLPELLAGASPEWRRALIERGIAHHAHDQDAGARKWLAGLPLTAEERAEFEPQLEEPR